MRTMGVTTMRAVVVYESMYGNTHLVADAIGAGLATAFEVSIVPVSEASPAVLANADLVVMGGPTHMHGMSRATTRKWAVQAAKQAGESPGSGSGRQGPWHWRARGRPGRGPRRIAARPAGRSSATDRVR